MEALSLIFDSVAMLIALYFGLRDDRRPPGTPQKSPFRTFNFDAISPSSDAMQEGQDRIVRSRVQ